MNTDNAVLVVNVEELNVRISRNAGPLIGLIVVAKWIGSVLEKHQPPILVYRYIVLTVFRPCATTDNRIITVIKHTVADIGDDTVLDHVISLDALEKYLVIDLRHTSRRFTATVFLEGIERKDNITADVLCFRNGTFLEDIAIKDESSLSKAAIYALADIPDREAGDALQYVLKNAASVEARKAAIYALGDVADESTVIVLRDVALTDREASLRKAAVYAIAELKIEQSVAALYEIFSKTTDPNVKKAALYAIAKEEDRKYFFGELNTISSK